MATICAHCLVPLSNGEPFLFAGTEVFHRECVLTHGTTESVGNKQRRQLASFEQRHQQIQSTLDRLKSTVAERDRQLATRNQQLIAIRNDLTDANIARTSMAELVGELRAQVAQATAERDKARQDLALAQLPPAVARVDQTLAGKDDAEIRFALLDLDDPPTK